jgi:hypothetical protein
MREKIAEVQHDIWSHWMVYLFSVCYNSDSGIIIPHDKVERWKRLMITSYKFLSEGEKESDRDQADKVLRVLGEK